MWAAYNGITQFIDHAPTKRDHSKKLEYVCFGDGLGIKVRAFEIAKRQMGMDWKP
jgi:hypothetical protein